MEVPLTPALACGLLDLPLSPTHDEVKKAFRTRAKETHPDKGGDEEIFKLINSAYALLMEIPSGQANKDLKPEETERPREPEAEQDLDYGDWLDIRSLALDSRVVPGGGRAQVTTVNDEVLIAVYLNKPWSGGSGRVHVMLSESGHDEVAIYDRQVVARSVDEKQHLTTLWFSPYERRMHRDGYPIDEPPKTHPPPPGGDPSYGGRRRPMNEWWAWFRSIRF